MNAKEMQIAFETSAKVIDLVNKPLTVDIFYYINLAQNNYIKNICDAISVNKDKVEVNSKINELQSLIKRITYFNVGNTAGFYNINQPTVGITYNAVPDPDITCVSNNGVRFPLPVDFIMYTHSTSTVLNTTLTWLPSTATVFQNYLVEETDLDNSMFNNIFNSLPIIRNGYVTLEKDYTAATTGSMTVYTGDLGLVNVELSYIRLPADMSLGTPSVECELPLITHNTIVDMAIDYYLTSNIPSKASNQYAG